MSDEKPHISTTQINMFCACAEQWRRRYLEGEIRPPRISMLVGTALHVGAETNWRQKIESRRDLPVAEIVDAAVAGFEQRKAEDGYELDSVECRRGGSVVLGEAVDTVADLAKVHAKRQAPEYQPTEVETRTTIRLDDASHDILAVTDLRTEDGQVVDLKTTRRKMAQSAVDTSLQLTTYYAAYCVDHDRPPESVAFDVLTIGSNVIDRHKLESRRDASDLSALANRVNMMLHAMARGVFLPTPPDDWRCTPAWCGYYETCPYVSKRK